MFTEFLNFVRAEAGEDGADDAIEAAALPHGGAYTAVGSYPFAELLRLVGAHARLSGREVPAVVEGFGHYLGGAFAAHFPEHFAAQDGLLDMLSSIDGRIHVEVRKLYPDAELPSFRVEQRDGRGMVLGYRSPRCLESLAVGLIHRCAEHYGTPARVSVDPRAAGEDVVRLRVALR